MRSFYRLTSILVVALIAATASAEETRDRVTGSGYFRLMARPDLEGGTGALGYWNLYGRLLNETSFAEFNLFMDLVQNNPGTNEPWARMGARVAFTGFRTADFQGGNLGNLKNDFQMKHFFLEAGNVFLKNVTWRFGTFDLYYNDLGTYDFRPSYVFLDTLGIGATYANDKLDFTLVAGDAGWEVRWPNYSTILTTGGRARLHLSNHAEIGLGGQYRYEPAVSGNRNSPYSTPNLNYQDWVRGEVLQNFLDAHPGQITSFPNPVPTSAQSFTSFLYLGFGGFGALRWDNFYLQFQKFHPLGPTTETFNGQTYNIYTTSVTDRRYEGSAGNEMQLQLIPDRLDAVWAAWFQYDRDFDDAIRPTDGNRIATSTLLRMQLYLTRVVHIIAEGSAAYEKSLNGNAYREHANSIFGSTDGASDRRGLQFGDSDHRNTYQGKVGLVLNPGGFGIFARPSIRLLYGLQYSSQQAAYGNGFVQSLDQLNQFKSPERHFHSVLGLETEGWF